MCGKPLRRWPVLGRSNLFWGKDGREGLAIRATTEQVAVVGDLCDLEAGDPSTVEARTHLDYALRWHKRRRRCHVDLLRDRENLRAPASSETRQLEPGELVRGRCQETRP